MLNKIIIVVCILFYVYHESKSDYTSLLQLNADVRFIETKKEQSVTFTCISLVRPLLCGVEFLLNYRTLDNLRLTEYGCYHGGGKCSPALCNCSDDCSTFQLNYKDAIILNNFTFGCYARFDEWMKVPLRAEVVKFYNATGLYTIRTTYIKSNISNSIRPSSQNTSEEISTILNPSHTNKTNCAIWTVLSLIESIILIGSSVALLLCKLRKRRKNNKRDNVEINGHAVELEGLLCNNNKTQKCASCSAVAICGICIDCEIKYCTRCICNHLKLNRKHVMCNLMNILNPDSLISCKNCTSKEAATICLACNKAICSLCTQRHNHEVSIIMSLNADFKRSRTI